MTILYKDMAAETLEAEYNVRQRRGGGFDELAKSWIARSAQLRKAPGVRVDIAYGSGVREKLDWFPGGGRKGPLLVYIHGGYWQRGDKSMYSFIADGLMKHGASIAVLNYDLTPSVSMTEISFQIRKAIAWIWHHAHELGFSREHLFVSGHSAGGHLTAMMMSTNWPQFDNQLSLDMIRGAIPISGLYELEPLIHTSINDGPKMDINEAHALSPCFNSPTTNAPQLVAVGGGETAEFLRQSDDYAAQYRTVDRAMERHNIEQDDHFDELDRLSNAGSVFFDKVIGFISK